MSTSENISLWKQKSEIDYIPLFVSLWLSLNAWMKDRFPGQDDRSRLNLLKQSGYQLYTKFDELIYTKDAKGNSFRANFAELHHALESAHIRYTILENGFISFNSCPIVWNGAASTTLESIIKTKHQRSKIQLDEQFWVEDEIQRLFGAYMEIVYQIRCALFHGDLAPNDNNERVIKQLYLTLSAIMEHV